MIVELDNAMKAGVPSKETFQKIMNSALDYTKITLMLKIKS